MLLRRASVVLFGIAVGLGTAGVARAADHAGPALARASDTGHDRIVEFEFRSAKAATAAAATPWLVILLGLLAS